MFDFQLSNKNLPSVVRLQIYTNFSNHIASYAKPSSPPLYLPEGLRCVGHDHRNSAAATTQQSNMRGNAQRRWRSHQREKKNSESSSSDIIGRSQ